jgi:hypothetical protein
VYYTLPIGVYHIQRALRKGPPPTHLFAIFREAQRECKRAYKKAKTESWHKLAGSVASAADVAKLVKTRVPKVPMNVNLHTKPDGSVCKDSSDNVQFLLQSHFTNGKILIEYPPGESDHTIWNEGAYEWLNLSRFREAARAFDPT